MKKIIGLALVAGCLAAMPVMAQAAEFPAVDIATTVSYTHLTLPTILGLQKG